MSDAERQAERRALEREARYSQNIANFLACLMDGHVQAELPQPVGLFPNLLPRAPEHTNVLMSVAAGNARCELRSCSRCGLAYCWTVPVPLPDPVGLSEEQAAQLRDVFLGEFPELRVYAAWLLRRPGTCTVECRRGTHVASSSSTPFGEVLAHDT